MENVYKVVDYIAAYINSVPTSSWVALATLLSGSAIVTAVVAWINRSRLKKGLERLGKAMVTWVVVFLSAVVTVLDFVITNGTSFGPFLPYFSTHILQVMALSTAIYNVAKPSLAWFRARKAGQPIENVNLAPAMEQVSSSFGTEATGRQQTDPNLIQL
jgi:hypothetical protein